MAATMPLRQFGKSGEQVSAIGYGAMGLAAFYPPRVTQEQADIVLSKALESGCNFWDTADIYSWSNLLGDNERQIGQFFKDHPGSRERVFLATKFGFTKDAETGEMGLASSAEYIEKAVESSLKNLGVKQIDLYYVHRPLPTLDVTEVVSTMKKLKDAGKIKYIGVSEYNVEQLEKVNKIAHIDALQIELSAWTPDVLTNGVLAWCEKNGTALVAYSPLGRGILTGQFSKSSQFEEGDFRHGNPRFEGENFKKNLRLVEDVQKIAAKKGCAPGQVALAWLLAQSDIIIPIPGTKKEKYLIENIASANVKLTKEEVDEISSIVKTFEVQGDRYAAGMQDMVHF